MSNEHQVSTIKPIIKNVSKGIVVTGMLRVKHGLVELFEGVIYLKGIYSHITIRISYRVNASI